MDLSLLHELFKVVVFFFQAEDGIRDGHVTGVQTCALPISVYRLDPRPGLRLFGMRFVFAAILVIVAWLCVGLFDRSEERRVGKECRSRWSGGHYKKNISRDVSTEHEEEYERVYAKR